MEDLDLLESLAHTIKATSLCGLGQTAPNPVLSTMKYFRDEYEAHIKEQRCPAGVCKDLISYVVDESKCIGCTACARTCPVSAISGAPKQKHRIDPNICTRCGSCIVKCPVKAIYVGPGAVKREVESKKLHLEKTL